MTTRRIASFREPQEAHLARGFLEASGVPAWVEDEHTIGANWLYSQAIGGAKVVVPDEYAAEAEALLDELEDVGLEELAEDRCPHCGARDVAPNPYSRWWLLPSLLLTLPVFWHRKRWRCGACGATW